VRRFLLSLLLVAAAAAAAIAANLALLDYASAGEDPVGKLSPGAHLPAAPAQVLPPTTGPVEHDGTDD
jgi:hypothetical protein